jgi:putative hydrolase of the HAD superfamily
MKKAAEVTCLFLDIGGVLLTNGWDHEERKRATAHFKLDGNKMEERHRLAFDPFEQGRITLDGYLDRVVFDEKRTFTRAQFRRFMYAQSHPYADMIELITRIKARYRLKVAVVSNEGRELNAHRIRTFKLDKFVDLFISSCYVHLRKPDPEILRLALDIAQAPIGQVVYIENTPMYVEVAEDLGIPSILHTDIESTRTKLASFGLHDIGE